MKKKKGLEIYVIHELSLSKYGNQSMYEEENTQVRVINVVDTHLFRETGRTEVQHPVKRDQRSRRVNLVEQSLSIQFWTMGILFRGMLPTDSIPVVVLNEIVIQIAIRSSPELRDVLHGSRARASS